MRRIRKRTKKLVRSGTMLAIICYALVSPAWAATLVDNDPNKLEQQVAGQNPSDGRWYVWTVKVRTPVLTGMGFDDETLFKKEFPTWTVTRVIEQLPGELRLQRYDAALKDNKGKWNPTDRMTVDYVSGGGFPPAGCVLEWLQIVDTNSPLQGNPNPALDPTTWETGVKFEDGLPFYWNETATAGSLPEGPRYRSGGDLCPAGVDIRFKDRPARGIAEATPSKQISWKASLLLVVWDQKTTLNVYFSCGIEWGFTITAVEIPRPGLAGLVTYVSGGVAGDKFDETELGIRSICVGYYAAGAMEPFGPCLDRLLFVQYASTDAVLEALDVGAIDIADALVTDYWLAQWASRESIVLSPCSGGWKAYGKYYSGGNDGSIVGDYEDIYRRSPGGARREWLGITNEVSFGVNCWGTFLNAYPNGSRYGNGNMTIRYGISTQEPLSLNPLYSTSFWEWQVLDKIYDTLMKRDPDTLQTEPWLAESWTVGTWDDNGVNHTKVTVTIRSDAKFMDGMPVTLADVLFSLVEVGPLAITKGFPPPVSYYPSITGYCILDSYTSEILFDVLDPGMLDAIVSVPILPKHIWKPIIDSSNPNPPDTAVPDPNLIGSGPYRFESWAPGISLVMVANKPGSTVNTGLPGSSSITSPGYYSWLPVMEYVYNNDGKHKYDPVATVSFNVRTDNLWWGGALDIADHVVITWPNASTTVVDYAMTLAAATSDTHTLGPYTWPKCKTTIEVNSTITTMDTPWTGQSFYAKYFMWGSIREDITGSTFHKDMGLIPPYSPAFAAAVPTPDCKVDVKDVAGAAAAFGARPRDVRWWSVADIVHDYKINVKDIAAIASKFGWK